MASAKNLIIVESPAKAKTIEKYLGKNFQVLASIGHVKDLPENELGVDIENNFAPKYKVIKGKKKVIDAIKKAAEGSENIYLAPDPDREGEAIAWHLAQEFKSKEKKLYRVLFNEITKKGVEEGIKNPGNININLVNSQQSRRILDRLVGYLVSPLLWKPLKYGLSAGRVQSVALRLITEREIEIEKFISEEYWYIDGYFISGSSQIKSRLEKYKNKKIEIKNKEKTDEILDDLVKYKPTIESIERKDVKLPPSPPFTTSKLQQDAVRKLGFTSKKTMIVAQQLYEGIELGKDGHSGLITYMRTDSVRVSEDAVKQVRKYIEENIGKEFIPKSPRIIKQKSENIQDAHEAIRPTNVLYTPDNIKKFLTDDQYKLYKLIWERFVASQMSDALFDQSTINITVGDYLFKSKGRILKFQGFMKIYTESKEDKASDEEDIYYDLNEDAELTLSKYESKQNFTTPLPRYSEAALVKVLEQKGIGRPSTYASIISTIVERKYVEMIEKKFKPTELGRIVSTILTANFPHVFDVKFTAEMEQHLDEIENGKENWIDTLKEFYNDFNNELKNAEDGFSSALVVGEKCPLCGSSLTIKYGKNGAFLACVTYPECKFTSNFKRDQQGEIHISNESNAEASGIKCEKCDKELVFKKSRFGEILACPGYPECKNIKNFLRNKNGNVIIIDKDTKIDSSCPKCDGEITLKSGRNGMFAACKNYPECSFTSNYNINEEGKIVLSVLNVEEVICEKCGKVMKLRKARGRMFFACPGYPECKNTKSAVKSDDGTVSAKK